jgi:hypothetical protein
MGKSTISMAIFNSYVNLPEGFLAESFEILDILRSRHHQILGAQLWPTVTAASDGGLGGRFHDQYVNTYSKQ